MREERKQQKIQREKEKRLKVNDQFAELCDMLKLGGSTRVEKLTILTETIKAVNQLTEENTQLVTNSNRKCKKPRSASYDAHASNKPMSWSAPTTPQNATPHAKSHSCGSKELSQIVPHERAIVMEQQLPFQPDANALWAPDSSNKKKGHKRQQPFSSSFDSSDPLSQSVNTFGFDSLSVSSPQRSIFSFGLEKSCLPDGRGAEYSASWSPIERAHTFDQDDVDNFLSTTTMGSPKVDETL
jgi:hypothetical protein